MQTVAGAGLMHEYSELGMCRWLLNEKVAAAWRIQLHPVLLGARGAIEILTIFLPMAVGLACGMEDGGQPGGGRPGGAQQESGLLWQDLAKTLENGGF